jgi:hypothetical protein
MNDPVEMCEPTVDSETRVINIGPKENSSI